MAAPRCRICARGDVAEIDGMIQSGTALAQIAKVYSVSIDSLERHRRNGHVRLARTLPAQGEPVPTAAAVVVEPLRTPDDVLAHLEWAVAQTKDLLQQAKAAGDLRLADKLLTTAISALDKLAKSTDLYSDGTIVNVDASSKKIELTLGKLSEERLYSLLSDPEELRRLELIGGKGE
jgi:hypothetical protein